MIEHEKPREWTVIQTGYVNGPSIDDANGEEVRVVEAEPVERELEELRRVNQFDIGVANLELKEDVARLEREREEMLDLLEAVRLFIPRNHSHIYRIEELLRRHGRLSDD